MRPIAMKCTQEEFDSIKDKLSNITDIYNFERYPYLTNDYLGEFQIRNTRILHDVEIHETFDANIFLEACDVEVEKVFELTDLQFRTKGTKEWLCYIDNSETEYRLKPQPNYQKEIEALQNIAKENGMKVIINFEKI